MRLRFDGRARRRSVQAVLPPSHPEGGGSGHRPASRALELLRHQPGRSGGGGPAGGGAGAGARLGGRGWLLFLTVLSDGIYKPNLINWGSPMKDDELKATVRERYGQAALRVMSGAKSGCCGAGSASLDDPITANLYSAADTACLPETAVLASLGCGNPTAL